MNRSDRDARKYGAERDQRNSNSGKFRSSPPTSKEGRCATSRQDRVSGRNATRSNESCPGLRIVQGLGAINNSLFNAMQDAAERGAPGDLADLFEARDQLGNILQHYASVNNDAYTTGSVMSLAGLDKLEHEVNVPIPSRGGKRGSSRYRFHCFLDGHIEVNSLPWIVEFKLRSSLTDVRTIQKMSQFKWYAWAWRESMQWPGAVGVLVDERLKRMPEPPRVLKNGKVSHAKEQFCTADAYYEACLASGVDPDDATHQYLKQRQWQQRVPLTFSRAELDEAGEELKAAARIIGQLDRGELQPIRNGSPQNCPRCRFKDVCQNPGNDMLIDFAFERRPAKRDLPALEAA